MTQFVRLYSGPDGESHFEELDPRFAPNGSGERSPSQETAGVSFGRTQPGNFVDWHTAPRTQYVITLAGQVEIGIGDGTVRRFGAGDVMLADDLTGRGHTTRVVGNEPRITITVPLRD
jgi:quercetin dioxygenase-like cupin family protein